MVHEHSDMDSGGTLCHFSCTWAIWISFPRVWVLEDQHAYASPHPTSHILVRIRKPGRGILGSQSKDAVSAGDQHFSLWHVALTQRYLGRWGGSDPERVGSETESSRSKRTTWQATRPQWPERAAWVMGSRADYGKRSVSVGVHQSGAERIQKQSLVCLSVCSCHKVPDGNHRKHHPVPD